MIDENRIKNVHKQIGSLGYIESVIRDTERSLEKYENLILDNDRELILNYVCRMKISIEHHITLCNLKEDINYEELLTYDYSIKRVLSKYYDIDLRVQSLDSDKVLESKLKAFDKGLKSKKTLNLKNKK